MSIEREPENKSKIQNTEALPETAQKKPGRLQRITQAIRKKMTPFNIILATSVAAHSYLFDEATGAIAERAGLETKMLIAGKGSTIKQVLRQDLKLKQDRDARRTISSRINKKEIEEFEERIQPVLTGKTNSLQSLHGQFSPDQLYAKHEELVMSVSPANIAKGQAFMEANYRKLNEQTNQGKWDRDFLISMVQTLTPGKAYESGRSSVFEANALGMVPGTVNCDGKAGTLITWISKYYPQELKNIRAEKFGDHIRMLYNLHGQIYVLEPGVAKFPDAKTQEKGSITMPLAGYLAHKIAGLPLSEVEGITKHGAKVTKTGEIQIVLSDAKKPFRFRIQKSFGIMTGAIPVGNFSSDAERIKGMLNQGQSSTAEYFYEADDGFISPSKSNSADLEESSASEPKPSQEIKAEKEESPQPVNTPEESKSLAEEIEKSKEESPLKVDPEELKKVLEERQERAQKNEESLANPNTSSSMNGSTKAEGVMEVEILKEEILDEEKIQAELTRYRKLRNGPAPEVSAQNFSAFETLIGSERTKTFRALFPNFDLSILKTLDPGQQDNPQVDFIKSLTSEEQEALQKAVASFEKPEFLDLSKYSTWTPKAAEIVLSSGESINSDETSPYFNGVNDFLSIRTVTPELGKVLATSGKVIYIRLSALTPESAKIIAKAKHAPAILIDRANPQVILQALAQAGASEYRFLTNSGIDEELSKYLAAIPAKIHILNQKANDDSKVTRSAIQVLSQREHQTVLSADQKYYTAKLLKDNVDFNTSHGLIFGDEINLPVEQMDADMAKIAVEKRKKAIFPALKSISPSVAHELATCDEVDLPGLKVLSGKSAEQLAEGKNLTLPGVILTLENLKPFESHTGELKIIGQILGRQASVYAIKQHDPRAAAYIAFKEKYEQRLKIWQALLKHQGPLFFNIDEALTQEMFTAICARKGKTIFSGIPRYIQTDSKDAGLEEQTQKIFTLLLTAQGEISFQMEEVEQMWQEFKRNH